MSSDKSLFTCSGVFISLSSRASGDGAFVSGAPPGQPDPARRRITPGPASSA